MSPIYTTRSSTMRAPWVVFAAVLLLGWAAAAAGEYPQIRITPANPTEDDSVVLSLILGTVETSCVPVCSGTVSIGTECSYASCPGIVDSAFVRACAPLRCVGLTWTLHPAQRTACEPCTTQYGVQYELGRLKPGRYCVDGRGDAGGAVGGAFVVRHADTTGLMVGGSISSMSCWVHHLGGVLVTLMPLGGGAGSLRSCTTSALTGLYCLSGLVPGDYGVSVSHEGYGTIEDTLALHSDTSLDFILLHDSSRAVISGMVWERDPLQPPGTLPPVAACTVEVTLRDSSGEYAGSQITDLKGNYLISIAVPSFPMGGTLTARKAGYEPYAADVWVQCADDMKWKPPIELVPVDGYPVPGSTLVVDGLELNVHLEYPPPPYPAGSRLMLVYTVRNRCDSARQFHFDKVCDPFGGGFPFRLFDIDVRDTDSMPVMWHHSHELDPEQTCDSTNLTLTLQPEDSMSMAYPLIVIDPTQAEVVVGAQLFGCPQTRIGLPITFVNMVPAQQTGRGHDNAHACSFREVRGRILIHLPSSSTVTLSLWTLQGRSLGPPLRTPVLPAGRHILPLPRAVGARGLALLRMEAGETHREVAVVLPATRGGL